MLNKWHVRAYSMSNGAKMRDLDHSRDRWLDREEVRANLTGHGTTRQGQASFGNTAISSPSCSRPTADALAIPGTRQGLEIAY
jgi:hypothetical protein